MERSSPCSVSASKPGDPVVTNFGNGYMLVTFDGKNGYHFCTPEQCTYHKGA
jgi:hypothetical protein